VRINLRRSAHAGTELMDEQAPRGSINLVLRCRLRGLAVTETWNAKFGARNHVIHFAKRIGAFAYMRLDADLGALL
jgi:hypothetical protein